MTKSQPSRMARSAHIVLASLLFLSGCDGDSTDPNVEEAFIGNWIATSFVVDGVELIDIGSAFNVSFGFFADGSYQLIVGGDEGFLFCDAVPSCVDDGDFTFSGNVITLDPGTVFELSLQYSVTGDTLAVSGNLNGSQFTAVFERI
ncbi:MAG TPA: hypothetical protein VLA09_10995 [Longimicrobiales bacterium]|nr:hypothetical protein [Longimicrobiales bacterium]